MAGKISEYAAKTVFNNTDLYDCSTDIGGGNFTSEKVTAEQLREKVVFQGVKRYKALLSQNAPITSQTSGTFTVGQIWTLTTYVAGDDFSNMELLSGTVNTSGSTFRAIVDTPTTWTNASSLAYDGSPYVVSTDVNGDLNPFVNTLGGNPVFRYDSTGNWIGDLPSSFSDEKVTMRWVSKDVTIITAIYQDSPASFIMNRKIASSGIDVDNCIKEEISIEVYP